MAGWPASLPTPSHVPLTLRAPRGCARRPLEVVVWLAPTGPCACGVEGCVRSLRGIHVPCSAACVCVLIPLPLALGGHGVYVCPPPAGGQQGVGPVRVQRNRGNHQGGGRSAAQPAVRPVVLVRALTYTPLSSRAPPFMCTRAGGSTVQGRGPSPRPPGLYTPPGAPLHRSAPCPPGEGCLRAAPLCAACASCTPTGGAS
jgi:hypothetical protein